MERLRMTARRRKENPVPKYNARILGLTVAFASGMLAFTGVTNAQATGENSGGSVVERATPQAVPGTVFAYSPSANIQNGAYTDPSRDVRSSLAREHLVLGHPYAVGPAPAPTAAVKSYSSTAPINPVSKDPSILSQH
jgi:hypothetical protein